jgi:hypothetical protein
MRRLKETAGFKVYEMEDDITEDLAEFSLANAIYAALEGHRNTISLISMLLLFILVYSPKLIPSLYDRASQAFAQPIV